MRLKSVWIKNFAAIKELAIDLTDHLVVIGGRNGQGKTSALKAIRTALGGKREAPEVPIRRGAKKAEIILEGDELTVEWSQTKHGSSIKVTNPEGVVQPSPVTLLGSFLSTLTFRPLEFATMDQKKQGEIVRKLAGLDFTELDQQRAALYSERTEVGRDLKRAQAALEGIESVDDPPEAEISVSELVKELSRRREVNEDNRDARNELEALRLTDRQLSESLERVKREIEERKAQHEAEIAGLNKGIADLEKEQEAARELGTKTAASVAELVDEDILEIEAEIDGAEESNRRFRLAAARARAKGEAKGYSVAYDELDAKIEAIDEQKVQAIQSAEYPIEGLSVDDEGNALLNGLPFDQSGDAEKLRCSAAIGFAINPDFKMLLIDQGEALDDQNLALLGAVVEKAGGQAIIARVGVGEECTVVIEDGEAANG